MRNVNFSVQPGETVGLVGDNGAGKSTLMKVLSGVYEPDSGKIYIHGRETHLKSPIDAKINGIGMIYQDLGLIEVLDVASNIFLGQEPMITIIPGILKIIDKKRMYREADAILKELKTTISTPKRKVKGLSGGQQKAVAIGKVLPQKVDLVIMDEPTAALGVKEVNEVLALIKRLQEKGIAVIIISHRLQDIFATCDRIVVMRNGQVVADKPIKEISINQTIELIAGTEAIKEEQL